MPRKRTNQAKEGVMRASLFTLLVTLALVAGAVGADRIVWGD